MIKTLKKNHFFGFFEIWVATLKTKTGHRFH